MLHLLAVGAAALLTGAECLPTYVGCDFLVQSSKHNAGLDVMTTSENIMGRAPEDDVALAVLDTTSFTAGSTVTVSFEGAKFAQGFAHASAGTFDAPEFTGSSTAAPCSGAESMIYKTSHAATSVITWTAPADVTGLPSVTLSFAGSVGQGQVSRRRVTLTRSVSGSGPATETATTTMTDAGMTSAATGAAGAGAGLLAWAALLLAA